MRKFYLNKIVVSQETPPLVIPEIGINHGGSLEVAKMMVDAAVRAGANIIKHQTHIVEDEMCSAAKNVVPGNSDKSIYDIMKRCALSMQEERELKEYCEKKGLVYLSTPFSRAAANFLEDIGICGFKIGSGECNNYPLLKHIAKFNKPMIVSTGMNSIESIRKTVEILRENGNPFVLLHTTNLYPTPFELVRLNAMKSLQRDFECLVGLSDHTTSNLACLGAVALGAVVLERHFTDTKERVGEDIVCSNDENELKELIEQSRLMHSMLGSSEKCATKEESITIDFAFASICSIKPIRKGETFTEDNIWVKRPSKGGIAAEHYEEILGKRALRDVQNDAMLQYDDIEK